MEQGREPLDSAALDSAADVLILSNGPGELATWVKPVVRSLRQRFGNDRQQLRISVVLSPCANASGREAAIARAYPEVDRVQGAEHFFPFLLFGKTADNWDWRSRGVVLFLGGDQFFPIVIGKRLGYRTVIYAEWEARWHSLINRFGVMRPEIAARAAVQYADKFTVVGDLMAEAGSGTDQQGAIRNERTNSSLIGMLPGSKAAKLSLGVPLGLTIAEQLHQMRPDLRFVIPVAPRLPLTELAAYADPDRNPIIRQLGWGTAELVQAEATDDRLPYLKTASGVQIELWTQFPAYDLLSQCSLCLTTVGANTAELGSLAVPMIVLLPTQRSDMIRAQDGLVGILANLPGVGAGIAKVANWFLFRRLGLLAWPNIWAKAEIVPEMVGPVQPEDVVAKVLNYLDHPELLREMRVKLRTVRGQPGAAEKLVQLVYEELKQAG